MSQPPQPPDEDAPWADGPGHLTGEGLPLPEEVAALEDLPPEDEVPPSPS